MGEAKRRADAGGSKRSVHYGVCLGGTRHGEEMRGETGVPWIDDEDTYLPCMVAHKACWMTEEVATNLQGYLGMIVWWALVLSGEWWGTDSGSFR